VLETVRSVGSIGTAPTLVGSMEIEIEKRWKSMDLDSPPVSPTRSSRRFSTQTLTSPITPVMPCRLRGIEDRPGDDDDDDDDVRYPYRNSR
jgi:hypothetical protein